MSFVWRLFTKAMIIIQLFLWIREAAWVNKLILSFDPGFQINHLPGLYVGQSCICIYLCTKEPISWYSRSSINKETKYFICICMFDV